MFMKIGALVVLFLIQLCFPQSKATTEVIQKEAKRLFS